MLSSGDIFVCLEFLILSFTWNFFAYFKFHSDWGRVIGKIKENEPHCRDTAPLRHKKKLSFKSVNVKKWITFLFLYLYIVIKHQRSHHMLANCTKHLTVFNYPIKVPLSLCSVPVLWHQGSTFLLISPIFLQLKTHNVTAYVHTQRSWWIKYLSWKLR